MGLSPTATRVPAVASVQKETVAAELKETVAELKETVAELKETLKEPLDASLDAFICPITHEIIADPVIDKEGNTYERAAILNWLRTKTTSPISRNPLNQNQLTDNRALKNAIHEHCERTGQEMPQPPSYPPPPGPRWYLDADYSYRSDGRGEYASPATPWRHRGDTVAPITLASEEIVDKRCEVRYARL